MERCSRGSTGCSTVEMLVVSTIVSLAFVPVFFLARHNVETTRVDRVRLEVESICHNTLERFGELACGLGLYLSPAPDDPKVLVGENVHVQLSDTYGRSGHLGIGTLTARHGLRVRLELARGVADGLDRLTCRATWTDDRKGRSRSRTVEYSRLIVHTNAHENVHP
ncbi:MAG: hypothetical protein HY815_04255 [Candidatus Riflebacteria bacterium]|nr:hypothetical protein [Candidatus Riflebacteria bacterium]